MLWRRATLVLGMIVALGVTPGALAASFSLATTEPATLDGTLSLKIPRGQTRIEHEATEATAALHGATGTVTIVTWTAMRERIRGADNTQRSTPANSEIFAVDNATIEMRFADEPFTFVAVARDSGALRVVSMVGGSGRPALVPPQPPQAPEPGVGIPGAPSDVDHDWASDWPFAGRFRFGTGMVEALPAGSPSHLDASGDVAIKLERGGTVSFRDADGVPREFRTVNEDTAGAGPIRQQDRTRFLFVGTIERASVPLGDYWGIAGPTLTWTLEGAMSLSDAAGWIEDDGARLRTEGADVRLEGTFVMTPSPATGILPPTTYEGRGEAASLRVDGVAWPGASTFPSPTPAGGLTWLALLAAAGILVRGLALLYSRLSRADVVEHPTRRRLLDALASAPGIHLRELHRNVGGAWGPFTFHLRVLERQKLVRVVREGRYAVAYPSLTSPSTDAPIRHPLARRIFESLPATGEARTFTQVSIETGKSRELVSYHLKRLGSEGRIRIEGEGPARCARRSGLPNGASPAEPKGALPSP